MASIPDGSLLREIVGVDLLEIVGRYGGDAVVVVDHELGQHLAVNQHNLGVDLHSPYSVPRAVPESRRRSDRSASRKRRQAGRGERLLVFRFSVDRDCHLVFCVWV